MKLKKVILLLTVLIFSFSMTACSSGQAEVDFDYTDLSILSTSMYLTLNIISADDATKTVINNTEGQEVIQTALANFEVADDECGSFKGFVTNDNKIVTFEDIQSNSMEDENYLDNILTGLSSEIVEEGAAVKATLKIAFEDRDAIACFVYVSDPAQTRVDETTGEVVTPFKLSELTVSPEYSFGEKMSKAAMNTLMGMGTVFVILIFIALIIGQFERLSKAIIKISDACGKLLNSITTTFKKEKLKAEDSEPVQNEVMSNPVVESGSENLMSDSQLVAVITAAIMASQTESGNAGSDGLIVRSIRKAKR